MLTQIPQNWQETSISSIANIDLGGTPSRNITDYWNGDIKWLAIQDIVNSDGRYVNNSSETITKKGLDNSAAKILPKNTVVISARGTVGEIALLSEPMAFNQSCYGLTAKKENELDQNYLYYAVKSVVKNSKRLGHGGVFNTFTKETFEHIQISLPKTKLEQEKIASILSAFDDKIEVNNKIAKTLEQMAQNIFKEWFIKFRFPGHEKVKFVDSELGKIPAGWEVGKIKDLGIVITGKTPLTENKENFGSEFPFITIPDINKIFITKTERYLSKISAQKMKNLLLPKGSICISCIATVGLVGITTEASFTNQQINSVIPKAEELLYFLFLYFKNKKKNLIQYGSGGTATLIINKTKFENLDIIIPRKKILEKFHEIVKPLFEKILSIEIENQKLEAMRDLLLPKLMRGKIKV